MGIPRARLEKTWAARDMRSSFGSAVGDVLLQYHWSPAQDLPELDERHPSSALDFWSGSQRSMWLFGSLVVGDSTLPLNGTISQNMWVGNDRVRQIRVHLEDNIGFGLMDPFTRWRFRRLFKRFAASIEEEIHAHSAAYREGEDAPDEGSDASGAGAH